MKRVLMITHAFPPGAGSGVIRTLKFVKYLPENGWLPVILTLNEKYSSKKDFSQQKEIPYEVKVYKTSMLDLMRVGRVAEPDTHKNDPQVKQNTISISKRMKLLATQIGLKKIISDIFSTPDKFIGWLVPGLLKGLYIVKKEDIKVIYATSPAKTSLLIGWWLKILTHKPLIVDLRDPWMLAGGTENINKTKMLEKIEDWLESRVLTVADAVIANTEKLKNAYISKYQGVIRGKITVITNGYDTDDFKDVLEKEIIKSNKLVISHIGEFYGVIRNPDNFMKAVSELLKEKKIERSTIKIKFIGGGEYVFSKHFNDNLTELQLIDVVDIEKHVPHGESLRFMIEADVLLLLQPSEKTKTQIPAKAFEYIYTGNHIIAITPLDGATGELMQTIGDSSVVAPDNLEGLKGSVFRAYQEFLKNKQRGPKISKVGRFDRKKLTADLAKILVGLLNK